ncbi:MAG: parallel beta-helix repeat-containing, partial [Prolixibacteraceae bacterium]
NDLRTLDRFGEWYYGGGKFYMHFGAANPINYTVNVSTKNTLLNIDNKSFITIKNLKFEGANGNAVRTKTWAYSTNNTIDNCEFDFNVTGLHLNISYNSIVTNCNFKRSSRMAVYTHYEVDGAYFAYNTIDSTGLVIGSGLSFGTNFIAGIGLMQGYAWLKYSNKKMIIEHNTVTNSGYMGINFSGDSAIVRYNYIDKFGLNKSDGGGIYYGAQGNFSNMTIDHNIVLNGAVNDDADGLPLGFTNSSLYNIYIDHLSTNGFTITNNTVAHTTGGGIFIHGGQNVVIENNTAYNCGRGVVFSQYRTEGIIRDIEMKNNIIVAALPEQLIMWARSTTNDFNQYGTFTNNYYAKPNDDNNAFATLVNTWKNTYWNFSKWKSFTKLDTGSYFIPIKLKDGEREELFYNNTNQTIKYNLGKSTFQDIKGEKIIKSFILEPFNSKVLIGKNFEEINQKPQISDHSFHIKSPKFKNDFIGQISANDPDLDQVLHYSIYKGNEMDWFSVDSINGKISAQKDIDAIKGITIEVLVIVKDNSLNSLSDSAKILIHIEGTDTSHPEITSFSIPHKVFSHYVHVEYLTAKDDLGIKGFRLSLTSEIPSVDDSLWTNSIPIFFYLTQQGQVIIYAWAIDFADNISNPFSDTVLVTFPEMSATHSEYLFEEDSGYIVFDSHNTVNGSIINEIQRGEGVLGNGFIFNGTGYVNLGKNYGENISDQITISAWLKPELIKTDLPIITHGGFYSNTFKLFLNTDSASIVFITNGTSNTALIAENVTQLWDGNWHHLSVTYNGKKKIIYLDGNIIAETDDSGVINSGFWNDLYIGAEINSNDTSLYYGKLDEVRIYNYALNDDEIGALFHSVNKLANSITTYEYISICDEENYFGWTETGVYSRVLQRRLISTSGADSIIIINLIVHPAYTTDLNTSICEGDTLTFNNQKIYNSGKYSLTLKSVQGCDSIISLKLNVYPKYRATEEISILSETNYHEWTTNGTYQRNLISLNGCDSIVITNLKVIQSFSQSINLDKGWNIFSTYLIPPKVNLKNVLETLEKDDLIISVLDENDKTYQKEGIRWVNNIGDLRESEGYKIRVNQKSVIYITGLPVKLPLIINLDEGWNYISFPYHGEVDAMDVIKPLIDQGVIKKVQDERGNSIEFWGNRIGWINDIGNFYVGEGYLVEVNSGSILTIKNDYKKSGLATKNESVSFNFKKIFEGNGFGHMNINITGLTELQAAIGDELAAFDGDKCVGAVKLSSFNITNDFVSIKASISDQDIINGFTEGNNIGLLVWRANTNKEFRPESEVINGSPIYQKHGSVFFRLINSNSPESSLNPLKDLIVFPNPAKDKIHIHFQIEPDAGTLISLTDLTGKQIFNKEAKSIFENLNIISQPSGIYLIKIVSGEYMFTKKILKS